MDWDSISNAVGLFRDGSWDTPIHIVQFIGGQVIGGQVIDGQGTQ